MTKTKIGRYVYYIIPENGTVKCSSTYAGIPVYGVAKCNGKDEFNEEIGKKIARIRCDKKINTKRQKNLGGAVDYWACVEEMAYDQVEFLMAKIKEAEE